MTMLATAETRTETLTLERTGQCPLRFRGTLLTTACGQFVQSPKDKPNADYYTVSIYAVANSPGNYVVAINYTKEFRGTTGHQTVLRTDDPAAALGEFDPLAVLIGFPPHQQYAERQQMLETRARRQYETVVTAVLREFPETMNSATGEDVITPDDLQSAAAQLGRSHVGRNTLQALTDWLDDDGRLLDATNQEAVFTLLEGALNGLADMAVHAMRQTCRVSLAGFRPDGRKC